MKEFEVPTINYPEIDDINEAVELLNKDEELKYNRVLDAIEFAHNYNKEHIDLFRLNIKNGSTYIMRCYKKEWENFITECLKYFEVNENFENCIRIKNVKDNYY